MPVSSVVPKSGDRVIARRYCEFGVALVPGELIYIENDQALVRADEKYVNAGTFWAWLRDVEVVAADFLK